MSSHRRRGELGRSRAAHSNSDIPGLLRQPAAGRGVVTMQPRQAEEPRGTARGPAGVYVQALRGVVT